MKGVGVHRIEIIRRLEMMIDLNKVDGVRRGIRCKYDKREIA